MSLMSSAVGITPASEPGVAFTNTITFITRSLHIGE
jgi:hypothetical protein